MLIATNIVNLLTDTVEYVSHENYKLISKIKGGCLKTDNSRA